LGLSFYGLVEQKTPQTKNRSSKLIFKDIKLIFFKENFLKITELGTHYKFHFGTFLLWACGAKEPPNQTIGVLSLFLKIST
jgi:hypothetical protein